MQIQFPNYSLIAIGEEIVNGEKRRHFNTFVWRKDSMLAATENKHSVIDSAESVK